MTRESPDRRRAPHPELETIKAQLASGDRRMTAMERSIADNTALTERIARNTEGLVGFSDDLASGSRFLCRFVKGMQFILRDVIDPYWKPTLVVSGILYWLTHDHVLPLWLMQFSKVLLG